MENVHAVIETQKNANRHLLKILSNIEKKPIAEFTKGYIQSLLEEVELTYKNFKEDHEQICESIHEHSILAEDIYPQNQTLHINNYQVRLHLLQCKMLRSLLMPNCQKLSGEYIEWIPYRDMFISLVHNNQSLSGIQKYFYLKRSCSGSPLDIINQYPASENNYTAAWGALEERYHNTRKIVDQTLRKLLNIPSSNGSFESIKELLDSTRSTISLLKSLNIEVDKWDAILIFLTSQKLDKQTRKEWEQSITNNNEIPPMSTMLNFLEISFRTLESVQEHPEPLKKDKTHSYNKIPQQRFNKRSFYVNNTTIDNHLCPCCQRRHPLYKCFKFSSLLPAEKKSVIHQNNICSNCLHVNHNINQCTSPARCQQCKQNHHTILHNAFFTEHQNTQQQSANILSTTVENCNPSTSRSAQSTEPPFCLHVTSHSVNNRSQVLLATANVLIKHKTGIHTVKALVDPGSQATFITFELAQLLNLSKQNIEETSVTGIGANNKTSINTCVYLQLLSNYNKNFCVRIKALVMKKLTSYKPHNLNKQDLPDLKEFYLSNPKFYLPAKIDILLGSDVYGEILLSKSIKFPNSIFLQESNFGWLVSGPVVNCSANTKVNVNICNLENQLRLFWQQEELVEERKLSLEEELCENYFVKTTKKEVNGRYMVNLPFKNAIFGKPLPIFYNTDYSALKRLKHLESTFRTRPQFAAAYKQFMMEYIKLNHMEKIGKYPHDLPKECFFFPHHGVIRESSETTKLRVVFDGSSKTPPFTSLNEELSPGPPLQNELPDIITRWRRFKFAFTADLEKMFRQINVSNEHQNYQCILWRDEITNDINIYKLKTVTYGTTCAPFLAIRVLKLIASNEADNFPLASKVINSDTYVDDVMSGADNLHDSIQLQQQLRTLLGNSGFNLRKWSSNSKDFLKHIPAEYLSKQTFELNNQEMVKALGLSWDTHSDCFRFKINYTFSEQITKSAVLSDSARLFDPLGWLSPTTILAKIMFQKLWREGLDWSDFLPKELSNEWSNYRIALKEIEKIEIPRWFGCASTNSVELHSFCDASKLAFAAVVYVRVVTGDGDVNINLIQSKTKVAPLKVLRIPKLELCAAVLAAKLVNKVKHNIGLEVSKITYWSDSSTVLNWIKYQSSLLPVYEANRVSQIQRLTNIIDWKYISSKDNPADCATRGLLPQDLRIHSLWWRGPHWLCENEEKWPTKIFRKTSATSTSDISILTTTITTKEINTYPDYFSKFSTFSKLQRVTAFILRWYYNLKDIILRKKNNMSFKLNSTKQYQCLTTFELTRAKFVLVKKCQQISFYEDIKCISKQIQLPSNTKIRNLQPFLDDEGVLRVGAKTSQQLMGNLPTVRVQPARPFKHSGLDYAGPIMVKQTTLRRSATTKGYICLFVCMCSKAIHLEAVSSLTTEAFLAAFRSFISRRGPCTDLYSDCGTTFVGATKELRALHNHSKSSISNDLAEALNNDETNWHFIPPASPHFGGLWEAGVKSTKHRLRRIMGDRVLTFEELTTLLCQIESILNSRPLCQLSSDPADLKVLTPAHFLVGEPTTTISEPDLLEIKIDRLTRWKQIEKLKQHFWQRWSKEYLSRLQSRPKWNTRKREAQVGDIVLLFHERFSPGHWPLARVEQVHPGADGHIRVVTLYCNGKYLKRPVTKICFLPADGDDVNDTVN